MFHAAVEGDLDEAMLRRIVRHTGTVIGNVYGRQGKPHLLRSLPGYNNAGQHFPWLVLIDLDDDFPCGPHGRQAWLPTPSQQMHFRVVVRAAEAWILADRDRIAAFLGVSTARIPQTPEGLANPKRALVDIARHSSRKKIRDEMVPREGSGRAIGPLYGSLVSAFLNDDDGWRPEVAAANSDSLARCIRTVQQIAADA